MLYINLSQNFSNGYIPFCFFIQFLEQFLKFLANFTLLKYVKSQRSYGSLITKKLIFGFQILDLKVHFSLKMKCTECQDTTSHSLSLMLSKHRKYRVVSSCSSLFCSLNNYCMLIETGNEFFDLIG